MMSEFKSITIQWRLPKNNLDPGEVRIRHYLKEPHKDRWIMTMVDAERQPLRKNNGELWRKLLEPGDNERQIAADFARDIERELFKGNNFSKPIEYPDSPRAKAPV